MDDDISSLHSKAAAPKQEQFFSTPDLNYKKKKEEENENGKII